MSYAQSHCERFREQKWGRDNVGARGKPTCSRIPKSQLPAFKHLLNAMKTTLGSYAEVARRIDISTGVIYRLCHDDYLSEKTARKILEGYNNVRAK